MDPDAAARLIESWGGRGNKVMGEGLKEGGEEILAVSIPVTPIRTGALRASGRVVGPEHRLGGPEVRVTFGGPSVNYAMYVHEILYRRPYTTKTGTMVRGAAVHHPVGGAKYLELPGYAMAKPIFAFLQEKCREIFKPKIGEA
jgi:hypothetical protein